MFKNMFKRVIAFILLVAMVLSPLNVLATTEEVNINNSTVVTENQGESNGSSSGEENANTVKFKDVAVADIDNAVTEGYIKFIFDANTDGKIGDNQKFAFEVLKGTKFNDTELQEKIKNIVVTPNDDSKAFDGWTTEVLNNESTVETGATDNKQLYTAKYKTIVKEVDHNAPITRQIPYHKNNKPNRIVNTIHGDPSSQRGFNWFTTDKFENSYVEVSKNEDFSNSERFEASVEEKKALYFKRLEEGEHKGEFFEYYWDETDGKIVGHLEGGEKVWYDGVTEEQKKRAKGTYIQFQEPMEHVYKAIAKDLEPETKYYYRIVVGNEIPDKADGFFTTSSKFQKDFSVIHYTDTQVWWANQNRFDESWYGNDILRAALEKAPNTDLVVHTGDIVEFSDSEDEWYDLLEQSKENLSKVTLAPIPGNHDEYSFKNSSYGDSVNFNAHFNVPIAGRQQGGSYYSFDYNNVHFTVINTNDYSNGGAISQEQFSWIEKDVKDAKERGVNWTILTFHKPIFSTSYHSLHDSDMLPIRHQLMKLIDDLDIDLVMWGHDHILSQTHGLKYDASSERLSAYLSDKPEEIDGKTTYKDPKGTIFVLPNTAGTKVYVDRYNKGYEYIKGLRYRFKDLSEEDYNKYKTFFNVAVQPSEETTNRNSITQHFATYDFTKDKIVCKIWQVQGKKGETRNTSLFSEFVITKSAKAPQPSPEPTPTPSEPEYLVKHTAYASKDINVYNENGEKVSTLPIGSEITGVEDGKYLSFKDAKDNKVFVEIKDVQKYPVIASGYAKFTQNIRNFEEKKVSVLPRNKYVTGRRVGNRVYIGFDENKKVYLSNLSKEMVEVSGYSKFSMWIRDEKGKKVGVLPAGVYLEGNPYGAKLQITYNGKTGYIYTANMQKNKVTDFGYTKFTQNIRDERGNIIGILRAGRFVKGVVENGKIKVNIGDKTGYIYQVNTVKTRTQYEGISKVSQYIRDKNENIVGILPKGVLVRGKVNGQRLNINYRGVQGQIWIVNID